MRVTVRLYGARAERAGRDRDTLDLPDDATAGDILREVASRHPRAAPFVARLQVAVNLEVVPPERRIDARDEVAVLPPVSGGAAVVAALRERPSVEEALEAVAHPDAGGTVVFVGGVRGEGGDVRRLEYSAYAAMAKRVLSDVAEEAAAKWDLHGVAVLHGVGSMAVGEPTVVVACSSGHRGDAFEACRYVIDEVKRRAPIWKKEIGPATERWVGVE